MFVELCLAVSLSTVIYILFKYICHLRTLKNYPPGPFPLPIIGNLHLIKDYPHKSLCEVGKQYGDIYSISFGMERLVIVNSIELAREGLIKKSSDFAGRPSDNYTVNLTTKGGKDMAFADYGPMWKSFRKVGHASLKVYGDGLKDLESLVTREIQHLHQRLNDKDGLAFDPVEDIANSVLNVICSMVFGGRYDVEDKEFQTVVNFSALLVQGFRASDALAIFPWLRFFPHEGLAKIKKAVYLRDKLFKRKLDFHKTTFDEHNLRDLTDSLLKESKIALEERSDLRKYYTEDHLYMILNDVFIGGLETITSTLRWALCFLASYPDTQTKSRAEIISIVGRNRLPSLQDKNSLVYTNALINEVNRRASVVPLGVPHKTTCTTSLGGFTIPKNTQVLFNHWAFHHDARHWDDPYSFRPERWVDKDNRLVPGSKVSFLPFSAGKRVCFGESLAKAETFLFLSSLIQKYVIVPSPDDPMPSFEGISGIALSPKPFKVIFRKVNEMP